MIANLVKQAVSAVAGGGTGNFTLSTAVSPYATMGNVFGGNRIVRYSAYESGVGFEIGYGTYTHSGTTLSRDTILETWNGTTYDATSPTALTFTTAVEIGIAVDSSSFMPSPMGNQDDTLISSAHLSWNAGSLSETLAADRQYAMPFLLTRTVNCAQLKVYCATGVDASASSVGISQMVDGVSASSYLTSGSITLTTAQNTSIVAANVTDVLLHPGWYFFHVISDSAVTLGSRNANSQVGWAPLDTMNTTSRATPSGQLHLISASADGSLAADPSTVASPTTSLDHIIGFISTT